VALCLALRLDAEGCAISNGDEEKATTMQMDSSKRHLESIAEIFGESIRAKQEVLKASADTILRMAETVATAFQSGRKLFIFGNGGSAADAQHIVAEFVNRFEIDRPPLPAIALTVDTSILTAVSNDFHFDDVFVKQLQALAQPQDVALGISTSGRSPNVLKALAWAREHQLHTLGLAGLAHTEMDDCSDIIIHVPTKVTARVQECHITVGHSLCALVDDMLFA
jgi:D-sedoheptulose 7-phosphate isomerase